MDALDVALTVNGQARHGSVEPRKTLADFLREDLELTAPISGASTASAAPAPC